MKRMIVHLRKNRAGKIFITAVASNGRKLFPTESFTQKPSAWTNIKSIMKGFNSKDVIIQDNTLLNGPKVYKMSGTGKVTETNLKPTRKVPN